MDKRISFLKSKQHVERTSLFLLGLVFLLGTFLRFYKLGDKGLWGDEIWTAQRSIQAPATILREYLDLPGPFYYLLAHGSLAIFGLDHAEFAVRFPSAVAGSLTILAIYLLIRRLDSKIESIIGAALLACSPYQVWYSQEARFYAWTTLLSVLSMYCILCVLKQPQRHIFWICFVFVSLLNLYNQPLPAAIVLGSQTLYASLHILTNIDKVKQILKLGISLITVAAGYIPPVIAKMVTSGWMGNYANLSASERFFYGPGNILSDLTSACIQMFNYLSTEWPGNWLFLGLFLIGIASFVQYRRLDRLAFGLIPFILTLLIFVLGRPLGGFGVRYVLFLQPLYLSGVASGITFSAMIAGCLLRKHMCKKPALYGNTMERFQSGATIIITSVLILTSLLTVGKSYRQAKSNDWRAIANYLDRHIQPGDVIAGTLWFRGALSWYLERADEASFVDDGDSRVLNSTKDNPRMWYIFIGEFDRWTNAIFRSRMERISGREWKSPDLEYKGAHGFFPYSEYEARLFLKRGNTNSAIHFYSIPQPNWTDRSYTHISAGEEMSFRLALAADGPRELGLTFLDSTGKILQVFIAGQMVGVIGDGQQGGGWKTARFVVPAQADTVVPITIKAVGKDACGVSEAVLTTMVNR